MVCKRTNMFLSVKKLCRRKNDVSNSFTKNWNIKFQKKYFLRGNSKGVIFKFKFKSIQMYKFFIQKWHSFNYYLIISHYWYTLVLKFMLFINKKLNHKHSDKFNNFSPNKFVFDWEMKTIELFNLNIWMKFNLELQLKDINFELTVYNFKLLHLKLITLE